jgi:hypothetical protein
MKINCKIILYILLINCFCANTYAQEESSCLFKNPLCFYNTDILNYLQILHKNQQYNKIEDYIYGPAVDRKNNKELIEKISNASFGYSLKRVGIIEKNKTNWSLTYQRTILGTNETFKIDCTLINNTCKIYIDNKTWNTIFNR